jgi:ribosomal protein S18 acetylase RimI-like enzyme
VWARLSLASTAALHLKPPVSRRCPVRLRSAGSGAVRVLFQAGMLPGDEAVLDNPAYGALCGPHARLAQVRGRARRYPDDVAPFLALPSPPSAQDWRDAAGLVVPGTYVATRYDGAALPDGWRSVQAFDLVQMIEERVTGVDCAEAIPLAATDVPEMLELVAQTEPGPFLNRTIELGDYLGIRRDGVLVAMAGERFRLDGWTEISAVCTKPEHRGQGLASRLMGALIASIQRRSERAFLHVMSTNTGAIKLYEELGFCVRQTATLTVITHEPPRTNTQI